MAMTKGQVDRIARETLAADCGCLPELLGSEQVAIVHSSTRGGRRYQPARELMIAAYGAGALIACSDAYFKWAQETLGSLRPTQLFSTACISEISSRIGRQYPSWELGGPHLRFLCATETLVAEPHVDGVEVRILARAEFAQLYSRRAELSNALGEPGAENTDQLLAAAYRDDELVAGRGSVGRRATPLAAWSGHDSLCEAARTRAPP